jgi:F0F1-type ATP synthase membrane subunit a
VAPAVGKKWVNTYTPLVACFFLFIVTANAIGPDSDLRSAVAAEPHGLPLPGGLRSTRG